MAITLSYFFINGKDGISPFLILPVIGAIFIIAFTTNTSNIIYKILSTSFIVYIGKISYSLYLWHWPVLVYARQLSLKENIDIDTITLLAIIVISSIVSYHFIEMPTRKNKKMIPYILSVLLIGITFSYILKTYNLSENTSIYNATVWNGQIYNTAPLKEWPESVKKRMEGITVSHEDNADKNAYADGGIKRLYGAENPEILVLGDSHALMWSKVLDEAAKELNVSISFYAADGSPTFFSIPTVKKSKGTLFFNAEEKYVFDSSKLKFLMEWKPKIVVISSRWSNIDIQETRDLIEYIGNIGSKILLVEQPPELFFGEKNAPQYLSYLGLVPSNNVKQYIRYLGRSEYQQGINTVKKLDEQYDYCHMIPISDIFLINNKVWVIDSYDALYIDDDHLSYKGALKGKNRIISAFKKYLK